MMNRGAVASPACTHFSGQLFESNFDRMGLQEARFNTETDVDVTKVCVDCSRRLADAAAR
jgi:hypothetical protein